MPFESEAQRRFMYSQHPELAKEFEKATPKDADLPEHVKKMADGGTSEGEKIEPGVYGETDPGNLYKMITSLAGGIGAGQLAGAGAGALADIPEALENLGETGSVKMGPEGSDLASKLVRYSKGTMGKGTPNEVEIQNVKGAPEDIAKLGFGTDPASIPSHILDAHGIPWEDAEPALNPTPESQNPTAPFGQDLRELWSDMAQKQSGTPPQALGHYVNPNTIGPSTNMAEGGKVDYPHVTFMEDQTPEGVKKTTHLAKSHEEPEDGEGWNCVRSKTPLHL